MAKSKQHSYKMNLFRDQLADSHRWVGITAGQEHESYSREVTMFTYEGGATYLWLMPTGQYEMEQISNEMRGIIHDSE